jgi:hypothetical protein
LQYLYPVGHTLHRQLLGDEQHMQPIGGGSVRATCSPPPDVFLLPPRGRRDAGCASATLLKPWGTTVTEVLMRRLASWQSSSNATDTPKTANSVAWSPSPMPSGSAELPAELRRVAPPGIARL